MDAKLTKRREPWRPYVVEPADAIPAERAAIEWDWDAAGKVRDVLVSRHPLTSGDDSRKCSGGACYSDWLEPAKGAGECMPRPAQLTPEGAFGLLVQTGFVDDQELRNAVVQFARIEGCVWAQAMLCSMLPEEADDTLRLAAERHERRVAAGG